MMADKEALRAEFKDVKVRPIDMIKFLADAKIELLAAGKLKENDEAEAFSPFAVVKVKDAHYVISTDCVGEELFSISLYRLTKTADGATGVSMVPEFQVSRDVDSLPILKETTLEEFMGDRFGYNQGILSNMISLKRAIDR